MKIGERIKELRRKNLMNQQDLAQILQKNFGLKTDRVIISKWETGFQTPNVETLICIAKIFGVSMDYISGIENDDSLMLPVLNSSGDYSRAPYFNIYNNRGILGDFTYLVSDYSMKNSGIIPNDLLIVKKDDKIANKDLVLIEKDSNIYLKKFISLEIGGLFVSDCEELSPIEHNNSVTVLGKVISVWRNI